MPFQPVILYTDALIYILMAIVAAFVWYARRHDHIKAPWILVSKSRIAMGSAVVIMFYGIIGISDTLHFHPVSGIDDLGENTYSTEVMSLFDVVTKSLHEQREKTYSAPFATHLFSKETIELESGEQIRDYPRLKYAGSHLKNLDDKAADITKRILEGMFFGIVIFSFCLLLLFKFRIKQIKVWYQDKEKASMHTTATVCLGFFIWVAISMCLSDGYHIFGTDKVGEDVFYQALKSIRTGLVIGTLTTMVMLPAAILLGIMAGYFRGWVDDLIQYLYTTLSSVPGVLLIAAAVLMMQIYMSNHEADFTSLTERADFRLLFLCLILGVTSWTSLCRLLRGESMKLRQLEYVQAAQAFGVSNFKILTRHLLPNVMHIVLIVVVLDFSGLVLAEAVLSYINIGVDPNTNSWGNMINSARLELAREPVVWWSLLAAFTFMFGLVLAANLFSDVVRDAFDPRVRDRS